MKIQDIYMPPFPHFETMEAYPGLPGAFCSNTNRPLVCFVLPRQLHVVHGIWDQENWLNSSSLIQRPLLLWFRHFEDCLNMCVYMHLCTVEEKVKLLFDINALGSC